MAHETDEDYSSHSFQDPDYDPEGGPVKTFLEHLEDLRWMLMRCVMAFAITFLLCLFAAPYLVKLLEHPLIVSERNALAKKVTVSFQVGSNLVSTLIYEKDATNDFTGLLGTNQHATLQLVPVTIGSNVVMGLQTVIRNEPDFLRRTTLVNLGPAAAFFLAVQLAIYGGLALASPYLLFTIGKFVLPALRLKEKKYTYWGTAIGLLLFFTGAAFCYFFMMPVALAASVQYSEWMGFQAHQWRAEEYIGFVSKFILGMGLGFELPVVLLVLVKIGILDYAKLAAFRRYMIVVNLILGAILTTPEIVTQVMMAIPLQILYEISVWIAWYWERKERQERKAAGETTED